MDITLQIDEAKAFANSYILHPFQCQIAKVLTSVKFDVCLVGSVANDMVVPDEDGHFDLDYQIRLSYSPLPDADSIRSIFFQGLRKIGFIQTENSTTALTISFRKRPYSYDFVIIDSLTDGDFILKRNHNFNSPNTNHYEWSKLRTRFDQLYIFYDSLTQEEKNEVRRKVLAEKRKNYKISEDQRRTGSEIFLQEVNNYHDRKK